ncbi:Bug family tripartite tricarboxylate transporter substrate binding protein [Propionivibrio limicola]|uniref:Bug family tripartite tricarboxylate transporter substrate binding protein n=1 Tax=Propionivibrio limicola TaxID=167645 RepID=UPI00129119C3|nr:tripartite tricarboxylate transporter substrate binding protein [Propionivibrio limicola]
MSIVKWSKKLVLAAGLVAAGVAGAADYPDHPINGVIAWGAGGGTDTVTRLMTPIAEKVLGKSVILANKTGATGAIATQSVYSGKTDGYTVLFHAENPQLYQVLGLSPLSYDEFEPVMLFVQGSTVIVVPKDSPLKTYDDLIKAAKANQGKMSIGISGVGGQPWVTSTLLKKVEGVNFNPVAFDGDGPLVTALLGKQLDVSGLAVGAAVQYIKNGDLRALAIMKSSPNESIPEVPHITKLNPAFTDAMKASGFFYGVFVKKGTPQPIIDKLAGAYKMALNDTKFKDYAKMNGLSVMGLTGKEARTFINDWRSQISWLIYEAGAGKNSPEKFGIPKPGAAKK